MEVKACHTSGCVRLTCICGSVSRVFSSYALRLNCVVKQAHQVKHTIRVYPHFIIYLHELCVGVCTPHRAGVHVWLAGDDGILVENIVSASSSWLDRCRLKINCRPCFLVTNENMQCEDETAVQRSSLFK